MKNLSVEMDTVAEIVAACADMARSAANTPESAARMDMANIQNCACAVVVKLITRAAYGSGQQKAIMDEATKAGFSPEYWGGGIRVSFQPVTGAES